MEAWGSEMLAALEVRDKREKALEREIIAYAKLADRTAILQNQGTSSDPAPVQSPSESPKARAYPFGRGKSPSSKNDRRSPSEDTLSRLRADLSKTQRVRVTLEDQVGQLNGELLPLREQIRRSRRRVEELEKDKHMIERRVKDRDEELKGKTRLSEEVQNEMVTLSLQLNMMEQKTQRLEVENQDLIDRWMRKMAQEADAVNHASKWS